MVILASASPRRQELLSVICDDFKIEPSDIDENINSEIDTEKIPEFLARKKAEHIFNKHPYDTVIGCDTGVFIDGKILGKPKDEKDAVKMLSSLSGKIHKVITGCAIFHENKVISFSKVTEVEFYTLDDEEIESYVKTGEPLDKAGSYGIQGKGSVLVKSIRGDYFNVVGLPIAELSRKLKEIF